MDFIEATSSGKDFRHPDMKEGSYFGFKDDELREFFADGGNSFPCFGSKDFFRDDWYFVPEPVVIEIGDEVECKICHGSECEIDSLGSAQKISRLHRIKGDSRFDCTCLKDESMLTLIRKGPKVHTFEGVTAQFTKHDGIPTFFDSDGMNLPKKFIDGPNRYIKTYTITVKEEVSE